MVNPQEKKKSTLPVKTLDDNKNAKPEDDLENLDDMSDWFKNNLVNPEDNPFTRVS